MKKQVYEIDASGYLKKIYVADFDDEGNPIKELKENIITVSPPDGLYRAKWTSAKWVEDMSKEEIDTLNNQPRELTEIEILKQEKEILAKSVYDLTTIVELILTGGIA